MKIYIDPKEIAEKIGNMKAEVEKDVQQAVKELAAGAHSLVVQNSQEQLKSSRKKFQDNLSFKEVAPGIWVITVNKDALWIEEGIEAGFDMKQGLLKNAETASTTGNKYKIIPFDHTKPPTESTPYQANVINQIRLNLKKQKVPFKKIEVNADGSPRIGKIHSFDFGGDIPGKGNTPVMKGVSIYQTAKGGKVRRDILTFRTVTNAANQSHKWKHPGYKGRKFLDKAYEWALQTWEREILPKIMEKWK